MVGDILHSILTTVTARVHPSTDPQETPRPKITYQNVGSSEDYSNDGVFLRRTGYAIDCWADTYKATEALARSAVGALSLYQSDSVHLIKIEDVSDIPASLDSGKEKQSFHRKQIRISITH